MNRVVRAAAERDIEDIVDHLVAEAAPEAAAAFIDELQLALRRLARLPRSGSLRFAYELALPDLRALSLRRHPYLIFYRATPGTVDVWRVLHSRRDIPPELG